MTWGFEVRPVWSQATLPLTSREGVQGSDGLDQAGHVLGRPRVNHVEVERRDRSAVEDSADSAHHDAVDPVRLQSLENLDEVNLRPLRHAASRSNRWPTAGRRAFPAESRTA